MSPERALARVWVATRKRKAARSLKNAADAGWEATIPFVPFQSEIAYNVEIKRSLPNVPALSCGARFQERLKSR